MKTELTNIEGFILAGGASSRMGRDKARLLLGETTLFERAGRAVKTVASGQIGIVGNSFAGDDSLKLSDDFKLLPDSVPPGENRRGAIIGVHTVLKNSKTAWAIILACDLPFVSGELLNLLAELRRENVDAVVPVQPDGRWQPLCALYRCQTCLPQIEEMLTENVWSLRELLRRGRVRRVEFTEISHLPDAEHFFLNVNTPADYKRALALQKSTEKSAARA